MKKKHKRNKFNEIYPEGKSASTSIKDTVAVRFQAQKVFLILTGACLNQLVT